MSTVTQEFYELQNNVRFEFLKSLKSRKILTIFTISAVMSLLFWTVPKFFRSDLPTTALSYMSNILGFMSIIMVLFALFLGADAINREHAESTDLLIYPLPQSRANVIIAKYINSMAIAIVGILFYYGIMLLTVTIEYGSDQIPSEIGTSILFAILYMFAVMAFSFLLSAVFKGTTASMTLTFFGLQLILPISNLLFGLANVSTDWIFTNYSSLITETLGIAGRFGSSSTDFGQGVYWITLEAILFLVTSLLIGVRREVGE